MGNAFGELLLRDAVYAIDAQNQEEVFDQLGERLMVAGLVREGYLLHVKQREAIYPTGLDMALVDSRFPTWRGKSPDRSMEMIKILAACGAGVNSSHQIKSALEKELRARGHEVNCDTVIIKDITEEMLTHYDIFAQIAKTKFAFTPQIPVIDCGPILYRVPAMAKPVYDRIEQIIKERGLK